MNGREQTRLRKAREDGYLDARCPENGLLIQAYGMWCWRLKIPMVWLERRARYSRFARVKLEMFTCNNRLNARGQERLKAVCAPRNKASSTAISPHDVTWDHVAQGSAKDLARSVFRVAVNSVNYERNQEEVSVARTGKLLQMA